MKGFWPSGIDRLGDGDERLSTFKQGFTAWLRAYDQQSLDKRDQYAAIASAWVDTVLDELAGWRGLRIEADELPRAFETHSPGEQVRIRAAAGLRGREGDEIAALVRLVSPSDDLRGPGLDGWAATEIDRMAALLRKSGVPIGLVTDGRWWAIVWAEEGKASGSGIVDALTWGEEPLLRDAFLALVDQQRLRAKDVVHRLPQLFQRSELEAEEITEALGTQVRRSVELLVQAFSEARLGAAANSGPDPLAETPDDVYQAAVTIMMRVVFLLFAEERGMLPTEQLYWDSYAIRGLLDDLKQRAADGEEHLDESHDVWHRLLAVSDALYSGVNYDEMRMPAYGGSLLDPARFPWLTATDQHGLRVQVSDRVLLHVLESVQVANVAGEARRISFREIDVEQIGYIYEGLLGYTCAPVTDDIVVGLIGKNGQEPEIALAKLNAMREAASDTKEFVGLLIAWVKKNQPSAAMTTAPKLIKLTDAQIDEAELRRLLTPVAGHNPELLADLIRWGNVIRRDLRGVPLVVPTGGLVVVETPSRRHAGAHYTPRSLAEEVVKHALEPIVYHPGPLETNDADTWKLKSSTAILDLKVADIAAGSGAFLVAAARFLAKRLTEAWTHEGMLSAAEVATPALAEERAIREVVARCLYGADINPMAVEMCKLSLWLVSLDKSKPFSFVDDKILCGNSLLGVTTLDQVRHLHINPDRKRKFLQPFVDVDAVLAEASRLRRELASPVDEDDPQRSTAGKVRLLRRADGVTAQLRLIADGVIAAGLALGGKPGAELENAYKALEWALGEAFPADGSNGSRVKLDAILAKGLTPTVSTDYERWQPLHWAIEVPDVMQRGGFDSIIGNPPFLGNRHWRAAFGGNFQLWAAQMLESHSVGKIDLSLLFLRRTWDLLARSGTLGLIVTNSLREPGSRKLGLSWLIEQGATIYAARSTMKWPTESAGVHISIVWVSDSASQASRWLDEGQVAQISDGLTAEDDLPPPTPLDWAFAFQGVDNTRGNTLVVDAGYDDLPVLLGEAPDVWRPYLTGDDITGQIIVQPQRYCLDSEDNSLETVCARRPHTKRHLLETVRPERTPEKLKSYSGLSDRWWQMWRPRTDLRKELRESSPLALAMPAVSKYSMVTLIPSDWVATNKVRMIAYQGPWLHALVLSQWFETWVWKYSGRMGLEILNLAVTGAIRTFPKLSLDNKWASQWISDWEESLLAATAEGDGQTDFWNQFHGRDPRREIVKCRDLRVKLDERIALSNDLPALHSSEVRIDVGPRFGWDSSQRVAAVAVLHALNSNQAPGQKRATKAAARTGRQRLEQEPMLEGF
ncbi:SAM-dependent DNA methyltransferase [Mycolicibacterium sp. P9-22]|nr:SAM-dependent DNA methyltransferase [Mycolicibacterium sp. P9-22]